MDLDFDEPLIEDVEVVPGIESREENVDQLK